VVEQMTVNHRVMGSIPISDYGLNKMAGNSGVECWFVIPKDAGSNPVQLTYKENCSK
jgi:hypothetical protein